MSHREYYGWIIIIVATTQAVNAKEEEKGYPSFCLVVFHSFFILLCAPCFFIVIVCTKRVYLNFFV